MFDTAVSALTLLQYMLYLCCLCICIPLHNPLQCEVAETVCQTFLSELHVLLTGRTWEQHRGMGRVLPPPPWVCPAHWEKDAGVEERMKGETGDMDRDIGEEKVSICSHGDS